MPTFLVVAIYRDNHQPYAQDFIAENAASAIEAANAAVAENGDQIWIAGVYEVHARDLDALECNDFARMRNVA